MKSSIKFSIIFFLCLSSINCDCATGNDVLESACDSTSCSWTEKTAASCGGEVTGVTCTSYTTSDECSTAQCTWTAAKGTCEAKSSSDGGSSSSGSDSGSSSSGSSNNTSNSDDDGAFGLKSSIFSFFLILLF